jgi:hypothetical protein
MFFLDHIYKKSIGWDNNVVFCHSLSSTHSDAKENECTQKYTNTKKINGFYKEWLNNVSCQLKDRLMYFTEQNDLQGKNDKDNNMLCNSVSTVSENTKELMGTDMGTSSDTPTTCATLHNNTLNECHDTSSDQNPIQYEQYSREYFQMSSQDSFDGFRLEAVKSISPLFQLNHSLNLGTTCRPSGYCYQFGPTFSSADGSLFLMSRYGTDGTMMARSSMFHKCSKFLTYVKPMFFLELSKSWVTKWKEEFQVARPLTPHNAML